MSTSDFRKSTAPCRKEPVIIYDWGGGESKVSRHRKKTKGKQSRRQKIFMSTEYRSKLFVCIPRVGIETFRVLKNFAAADAADQIHYNTTTFASVPCCK